MKKVLKSLFFRIPASYVLMLHHVDDGNITPVSDCIIQYDQFIRLLKQDRKFMQMSDYLTFKAQNNGKYLLTFDDGLEDVFRVVYPVLKAREIPFTIFVPVDLLDTPGYISIEQLKEMAKDPLVTIGSHGVSHRVMTTLSVGEQELELVESKKTLQRIIGKSVDVYAYPHGQFNSDTIKLLKKLNLYKAAFGVTGHPTNCFTESNRFDLPRFNIKDGKQYMINFF
ncbi:MULTISPECIES: polysaccharide deacetylase family protein [Eubacteriales]|jgi:peptidoglycan/xylan/chitin deacetylase (PgdA/CDA1 family)|uniref:polysaccharide deacetylase family protein n=1 Tax=Eubacteriales TaxID=186802 RepID=UPI0015AFFB1C|nr:MULTISPECIES: polysaccharide deacetylase family protein [Eubacteriales]